MSECGDKEDLNILGGIANLNNSVKSIYKKMNDSIKVLENNLLETTKIDSSDNKLNVKLNEEILKNDN